MGALPTENTQTPAVYHLSAAYHWIYRCYCLRPSWQHSQLVHTIHESLHSLSLLQLNFTWLNIRPIWTIQFKLQGKFRAYVSGRGGGITVASWYEVLSVKIFMWYSGKFFKMQDFFIITWRVVRNFSYSFQLHHSFHCKELLTPKNPTLHISVSQLTMAFSSVKHLNS